MWSGLLRRLWQCPRGTGGGRGHVRRTPALLACALVAVGTLLSRPAPLCACSTELTMRLTVMRSDLLVLAEAQAALRDSTGRYGDLPELTFRSAWPSAGAGVVVLGFASTPAGFSAVLGNTALAGKDGDGMRCAIAVGPNPVHVIDSSRIRDGPQCDPYPIAGGHLLAGIAYLGLLMVSGIVLLLRRPRRPGGGAIAVPWTPVAALIALAIVHPFWEPVQRPHPCESISPVWDAFALLAAGLLLSIALGWRGPRAGAG